MLGLKECLRLKIVRFLGELLWTEHLTVETELRFQISLAECGRDLSIVCYQVFQIKLLKLRTGR